MNNRPFRIYVHPVSYVYGCAEKREQEEVRHMYGFHGFEYCDACLKEPYRIELWGENGHMQGSVPRDGDLWHMMRAIKARHPGTYYVAGPRIYYKGGWRERSE